MVPVEIDFQTPIIYKVCKYFPTFSDIVTDDDDDDVYDDVEKHDIPQNIRFRYFDIFRPRTVPNTPGPSLARNMQN